VEVVNSIYAKKEQLKVCGPKMPGRKKEKSKVAAKK